MKKNINKKEITREDYLEAVLERLNILASTQQSIASEIKILRKVLQKTSER